MKEFSSDDGGERTQHKIKVKNSSGIRRKLDRKWITTIIAFSFFVSVLFSLFSDYAFKYANIYAAPLVLLLFIGIGILFDIIGVAVTAANEAPFHAMAAKKTKGAKEAISLIRNAEKVASFCNDVVGDIVGIASGAAVVALISFMTSGNNNMDRWLSLITTGAVAACTIGGKAIGKTFAINNCNNIVYFVAVIFGILHIKIDIVKNDKRG